MDEDELSRLHRSSVYLDSQAHMAKIFSKDPQSWPGAIKIQNAWRGYRARKSLPLRINESLHLGYELFVMKKRLYRRKMLVGFFKHVVFMLLLSVVVWLQLGQTIHNRHELEHTVDEMVQSLETPEGLGFNSVSEVGDAWQWVRRGLFTKIANADELNHVYVRTYNLLVGSIRLETTRVSSSSCSWPDSLPRAYRLKSIPPDCYGKGGGEDSPYGPSHDPRRYQASERHGETRYVVDLGVGPKFAALRLQELATSNFLSKNTRTLTISFLLYNHALPMLCYTRLKLFLHPTGRIEHRSLSHAVSVQAYMDQHYWVQAILEVILLLWTFFQAYGLLARLVNRFAKPPKPVGFVGGAKAASVQRRTLSLYWILGVLRVCCTFIFMMYWIVLYEDGSRDLDLSVTRHYELERVTELLSLHEKFAVITILLSLITLLEFFDVSDRLAIISRTIRQVGADLPAFFFLFIVFWFTLAFIGFLLYGHSLIEFSYYGTAINTCWDIMLGNFVFSQLEPAYDPDDWFAAVAAVCFFYSNLVLMLLLLFNMLIAIFMDAFARIKADSESKANALITYNMGPLWKDALQAGKLRLRYALLRIRGRTDVLLPWTESRWMRDTRLVAETRYAIGQRVHVVRLSTFISNLRALPTSKGEDVTAQVKLRFGHRRFIAPPKIDRPFDESTYKRMIEDDIRRVESFTGETAKIVRNLSALLESNGTDHRVAGAPCSNDTSSQVSRASSAWVSKG